MKRFAVFAAALSLGLATGGIANADDGARAHPVASATGTVSGSASPASWNLNGWVSRSGGAVHELPNNTSFGIHVPVGTPLVVHCYVSGTPLENQERWAWVTANKNGLFIKGHMHFHWIKWEGALSYC
ncbi:hypothetical protein [Allokutzneria albata]|uniref:Ig-like domain-containing protein n=1 Tax=Allokutzneria albata TaxID=211114 RepID=A0A1G9SCM2_ALLAB|nr:hypothetical protein [Allokutzneria albata]SDM33246.1 hypothetical protein SAMN04489726_1073 [Allokutzneria albata]